MKVVINTANVESIDAQKVVLNLNPVNLAVSIAQLDKQDQITFVSSIVEHLASNEKRNRNRLGAQAFVHQTP